ncbi:MAG: phosphate transport system regulatory protein PhoU [Candidatus Altiarchaeales archaeon ex4484_96]|nr:MAG: phosphate transport system regulatory protein PhoU [Candidatus Altiarchaeales archaeon ex4484_96]
MPRTRLEREMDTIRDNLQEMGLLISRDITDAMNSLERRDVDLAENVIKDDKRINDLYSDLKERCIQTIALHQPVARDLRFLTIAIDVVYNMERIADYADDIAEIVYYVRKCPENMKEIREMGVIAKNITENAYKSFLEKDLELVAVVEKDEELMDEFFEKIFPLLKNFVGEKPEALTFAMNMIMVAKYLERIADHAFNIAQRTRYAVLGDTKSL